MSSLTVNANASSVLHYQSNLPSNLQTHHFSPVSLCMFDWQAKRANETALLTTLRQMLFLHKRVTQVRDDGHISLVRSFLRCGHIWQ